MKRTKDNQGFTLVEMIVVLIIIAILATILVPTFSGWIKKSSQEACDLCRADIIRHYRNVRLLENAEGREVKLSDVLAGEYEMVAGDIANDQCPSGGAYTADDATGTITCSYHDEDAGGDDPGDDEPGGTENTASVFYLLGNPAYQVSTRGDLEQFKQKLQDRSPEEEPGANIATGTIFYYRGDYYLFRDYQYITGGTDLSAYIAGYGVKINNTVFTTPSAASQPGDIKLVDGKVYVFFPYSHSRYDGDYNNAGWWYEIALTP